MYKKVSKRILIFLLVLDFRRPFTTHCYSVGYTQKSGPDVLGGHCSRACPPEPANIENSWSR